MIFRVYVNLPEGKSKPKKKSTNHPKISEAGATTHLEFAKWKGKCPCSWMIKLLIYLLWVVVYLPL
jgi:hypothetical protein